MNLHAVFLYTLLDWVHIVIAFDHQRCYYFGTCTILMLKGEVPHLCQLYACTHINGYVHYNIVEFFPLISPVVSQVYLLPWHIALITISALVLLVALLIILTGMVVACGCKLL